MDSQIERRKVYELVAERLVAAIGSGELRPGDPVPSERELTERFDVGRSSVREALRLLESKGLIAAGPKGSLAVARFENPLRDSLRLLLTLEQVNPDELYGFRLVLEAGAAALAAGRADAVQLHEMTGAIERMERALAADSPTDYIDADLRFHLAIAEASGNRLLFHSMNAVRDLLRRALQSTYLIPASPETSILHHRAILDAIARGDAAAAERAMRAHLNRVRQDIAKALEQPLGTGAHG